MIVNGVAFKIYLFDTLESVKERICVQLFPDVLNKFILDLFLNPSRRIEFGLNAIQCSRYFNVENSKIITA
jgi:hypothetical protein